MIKSSIIWDIVEDRNKQLELKKLKKDRSEPFKRNDLTISAMDMDKITNNPRLQTELHNKDGD